MDRQVKTLASILYRKALAANKFLWLTFSKMLPAPKFNRSVSLFSRTLADHNLYCHRKRTDTLQLNLGKLCNLTCVHCHVNAGPKRREIITRETIDRILGWLANTEIRTVDLTGGAPEMMPDFRYLVGQLRKMPQVEAIIDRCNLTILLEPGYEWLADFLVVHRVKIVASMPCYELHNVDAQRGEGVFDSSIRALQLLNRLGYGRMADLPLDLVYNPNGDFLPPDQTGFESDYKRELKKHFDIDFHRLYTLTNMPSGASPPGSNIAGSWTLTCNC